MAGETIVVTGGGGFIGGWLVKSFLEQGHTVRSVDIKPIDTWYQRSSDAENVQADLREKAACYKACEGATAVYNLAADMGGMGFIENNKALCMLSVLINTHMLMAARDTGVQKYFYSSSACVYNADKQASPDVSPLKEADAYPAMPEDGYGWEKLFSERMCRHFHEDFGLETYAARFHNVYGPCGAWEGGREKAPAAICRKIAEAKVSGKHEIEIWGDGTRTRSFTWIDDCVKGIQMIVDHKVPEPINLGSDQLVTINQLVDIVEAVAGITLKRNYKLDAPQGVNGRNSDNTKIKEYLNWAPATPLEEGMAKTYESVYNEYVNKYGK